MYGGLFIRTSAIKKGTRLALLNPGVLLAIASAVSVDFQASPGDAFIEHLRQLIAVPAYEVAHWNDFLPDACDPEIYKETKKNEWAHGLHKEIQESCCDLWDFTPQLVCDLVENENTPSSIDNARSCGRPQKCNRQVCSELLLALFGSSQFPRWLLDKRCGLIKATCSSLDGPVCLTLESSPIASTLIDGKSIPESSLYKQRMLSLMRRSSPPKLWLRGKDEPKQLSHNEWNKAVERLTLSGSAISISRFLMAADFGQEGLTLHRINDFYTFLTEASKDVWGDLFGENPQTQRRSFFQPQEHDKAPNEAYRLWLYPGEAVPVTFNNTLYDFYKNHDVDSSSDDPGRILIESSYTLRDLNSPDLSAPTYDLVLGPFTPLALDEVINHGFEWVRTLPLRSLLWKPVAEQVLVNEQTLQKSWLSHMHRRQEHAESRRMAAMIGPTLKGGSIHELVKDEASLMELLPLEFLPLDWQIYAAAMGISSGTIDKWLRKVVAAEGIMRHSGNILQNIVQSRAGTSSSSSKTVASSTKRTLAWVRRTFMQDVLGLYTKAIQFLLDRVADILSRREEWEQAKQRIQQARARKSAANRTVDTAAHVNVTANGTASRPQAQGNKGTGQSRIKLDDIERLVEDYENTFLFPEISPVEFGGYTGGCVSWNISQFISPDQTMLPRTFARGLPTSMSAVWLGWWTLAYSAEGENDARKGRHENRESVSPALLSQEGEIHLNPSIVIQQLHLTVKALDKKQLSKKKRSLKITGAQVRTLSHTLEEEIDRWRSGKEKFKTNEWRPATVETVWTIDIEDLSVITEQEESPILLDLPVLSRGRQNSRVHTKFSGSLLKRVNIINFEFIKENEESSERSGRYFPIDAVYALELHRIDFNKKRRYWSFDFKAAQEALMDQKSNHKDIRNIQTVLLKAIMDSVRYPTAEDAAPMVTISSSNLETLTRSQKNSLPKLFKKKLADLNEEALRQHLQKYNVSIAERLKASSGNIIPGEVITRGFGLHRAAQLTPDSTLSRRIKYSLTEGGPSISRDGVVYGRDTRPTAIHVDVQAMRAPIEAPLVSLYTMHRQNLIVDYSMTDPQTQIRYTEEAFPVWNDSVKIGEMENKEFEKLRHHKHFREKLVRTLKNKLESSVDLRSALNEFQKSLSVSVADKGGGSARRSEGFLNELLERGGVDGKLGEEEGVETASDASSVVDQFLDSLAGGVGPAQKPIEFSPTRHAAAQVEQSVRDVVQATLAAMTKEQGEATEQQSFEKENLLESVFREVNILTIFEDVETGELITKNTRLDLQSLLNQNNNNKDSNGRDQNAFPDAEGAGSQDPIFSLMQLDQGTLEEQGEVSAHDDISSWIRDLASSWNHGAEESIHTDESIEDLMIDMNDEELVEKSKNILLVDGVLLLEQEEDDHASRP